jgi:hypothetical protein
MHRLFNVLDLNNCKILLQGIERAKGMNTNKAITIIQKEQVMIYLDEVLQDNEVCSLRDFNTINYIVSKESLKRTAYNKKMAYENRLFQKHKIIFNRAVAKHGFLKRLKYLLVPSECLTCKP